MALNNFYVYDITFLVLFTLFIVWFLYSHKKNLKREGLLYLYRTKLGIKAIDYVSSKYKRTLNILQYVSITCGYVLMVVMLYLFFQITYIYISSPEIVRAVKVPPVIPLVPYLPEIFKIDFLPPFYFTYWILILAVIAISHEFAHGIFAKFHKVNIKSTGFGFLGPFLAAFVEPDEKHMEGKSIKAQLSILSAGTFANIIMAIVFIFVLLFYFKIMFFANGVVFNSYSYNVINISGIDKIEGNYLDNPDAHKILKNLNLGDKNNLTRISYQNKTYLIDNNEFVKNVEQIKEIVYVYEDLPAINANLKGAIIEINNQKINSQEELRNELSKYNVGENINIKTVYQKNEENYEITLVDDGTGRGIIGIGFIEPKLGGIKSLIYGFISMIKDPGINYEHRLGEGIGDFIFDLLWWMIFLNLSVALVNMLPLGIFDGGKFFYLTIFHFSKSKDIAQLAFKTATWFLLGLLALIMVFYGFSFI